MDSRALDMQYCERLFKSFYDIGALDDGGVSRLGYTEQEDQMHDVLVVLGEELQCAVERDEVGNTYVLNSHDTDYYLIGSHLDSVIDGGRYDGVAGVIAGLLVMKWAKEDSWKVPLRVGAFRCEESSNFGCCTIGSGLVTGELDGKTVGRLVSRSGEKLEDVFRKRNLTLYPPRITGVRQYLELHIEQGKVLEKAGIPNGIVTTIAGPKRFKLYLRGMAEHSGATPMGMRFDAMCAAAEVILGLEELANRESVNQSVATVGIVNNYPNVLNVIPGEVELGVDIRGIDSCSLDRMEKAMHELVAGVCKKRGIEYREEKIGDIPPVAMSHKVQSGLEQAAMRLGIKCQRMPSGAGHDAMSFAGICDTGMLFIPCEKGVSHNSAEAASLADLRDGARVLYEYLKEAVKYP